MNARFGASATADGVRSLPAGAIRGVGKGGLGHASGML